MSPQNSQPSFAVCCAGQGRAVPLCVEVRVGALSDDHIKSNDFIKKQDKKKGRTWKTDTLAGLKQATVAPAFSLLFR